RQAKNCQRVEITLVGKGAPVRAEASAGDFYAALDVAINRLETRLKRKLDRRKVHYGQRSPVSVAEATAAAAQGGSTARQGTALLESPAETSLAEEVPEQSRSAEESYEPGRIVRVKEHPAHPMTVDQALYEMELVGHDFYLFNDAESGKPSVVYRRKGFDYGLIRLDEQAHQQASLCRSSTSWLSPAYGRARGTATCAPCRRSLPGPGSNTMTTKRP